MEKRNYAMDEESSSYYQRQITGKDFPKQHYIIKFRSVYVARNLDFTIKFLIRK
jgi:hypothetical protein